VSGAEGPRKRTPRSGAEGPPRLKMTLAELNAHDRSAFVAALGWIFEESPWVAERAWEKRPFPTLDALHGAMTSVVTAAPAEEQLALLRAHPDLGTVRLKPDTTDSHPNAAAALGAPAGSVRLQADPQMSDVSRREQTGAGLDALTRDELERLRKLNAAYREKFGFPFLFAVKGSTTRDILAALERRLPSTRDIEHQEALRQVYRIARFRLEETVRL
jgi:2-oxo-4-hydroxy-4-carboxy-5-ureidoimidazoline decarboxylase